jgi:phosphoglycerate dehydrogenase-like enzyme
MNLLITGAWAGAKDHIGEIEALGHTVRFMQQEKDPLPCEPDWAEGVVCNGLFLYHPITEFKNLRFIQLTSAGYDRVDMDYVNAQGIEIHNARGVYSIPMAEFAVSGVLELYKQARFFLENQQARRWEKHRGLLELFGRAVTIVGCGSVGTECAKRFKAFGCRVTGVDIAPRRDDAYDAMLPIEKLDEALPASDVLVLTVPLTKATERLIDARRLELMNETAVVVNISRGRVIDETALAEKLRTRRLMGAVLDVFETEPLPASSPLWELDNVILTPHNSFVGSGNAARLTDTIFNSLSVVK